jgi:hypothetical protein
VLTDVSEEHIASIFRVEEISSASKQQRTTRRYIPEVDTLHNHRCENLKSYKENEYHLDPVYGALPPHPEYANMILTIEPALQ